MIKLSKQKDKANMDKVQPNTIEELSDDDVETMGILTTSDHTQQSKSLTRLVRRGYLIDNAYRKWEDGEIDANELLLMILTAYRRFPCPNTPISDENS